MNFIKAFFEEFSIHGTQFSFYYDGEFRKLHVLDHDREETRTVTNAACKPFFERIDHYLMETFTEPACWAEYDIYLYGTDGVISEFDPETNGFKHVDPWDGHIYEPFKKVCAHRYMEHHLDKI